MTQLPVEDLQCLKDISVSMLLSSHPHCLVFLVFNHSQHEDLKPGPSLTCPDSLDKVLSSLSPNLKVGIIAPSRIIVQSSCHLWTTGPGPHTKQVIYKYRP
jgi:hypothetical protein